MCITIFNVCSCQHLEFFVLTQIELEQNVVNVHPKNTPLSLSDNCDFSFSSGSIEMLSLDTSSKFYDGFWAYLPCKIHRKVLEFSKEMPGVILCSSVPCCNISLEVFQNDMPNIDDIALIFFPGNFQRCTLETSLG